MGPGLHDLLQNVLLRTERGLTPSLHVQNLVDCHDCTWPMRNDNDNRALTARLMNSIGQRRITVAIQIGVRFVQHDEKWCTIERPRQADALALTRREQIALLANPAIVTVRHGTDKLVDAGCYCRSDDSFAWCVRRETGDVFRHSAVNNSTRPNCSPGVLDIDQGRRAWPLSHSITTVCSTVCGAFVAQIWDGYWEGACGAAQKQAFSGL